MTNAELYRLIINLIRFGTVEEIDLSMTPPKVRVRSGELLTDWIPWLTQRAGSARTWWPPTVDEQVVMLAPGGELATAVILAALYQETAAPPATGKNTHTTRYPDNALFQYEPDTGTLTLTGIKKLVLCATEINIDSQTLSLTGTVSHSGDQLSSNGKILHSHKHGGVKAGGDATGTPQ